MEWTRRSSLRLISPPSLQPEAAAAGHLAGHPIDRSPGSIAGSGAGSHVGSRPEPTSG